MNCSPFSCPIFLGHPEARGPCSQGERVLYGRDLCCSGGAAKAEAAKLPDAGISLKQCPEKSAAEKGWPTEQERSVPYQPSYVSRQSGTEEISRATIATAPTMALDSSGSCVLRPLLPGCRPPGRWPGQSMHARCREHSADAAVSCPRTTFDRRLLSIRRSRFPRFFVVQLQNFLHAD